MQTTYLGCVLKKTLPEEPMALRVFNKINEKLKFMYQKNKFPRLRRVHSRQMTLVIGVLHSALTL